MNINYVESICPHCGAKNREGCNTWMYGSPIRTCKSCNHEYLERKWREVAIDGFDPRSTNAGFYLKGGLGMFAFGGVCLMILLYLSFTKGYYPTKLLACVILSFAASVICLIMFLRIKLGFDDKYNAVFLEESKNRLKDPEYIKKLEEYGYTVPDEYKKAQR